MELVDVSGVSAGLFIVGILFIIAIGSFLSLGTLRFFQLKKKQGGIYMVSAAVSFVALILVVNKWFA